MRNIIACTEGNSVFGFIISLDIEKAFDRVDRTFLWTLMRKLGFGERFVRILPYRTTTKQWCYSMASPEKSSDLKGASDKDAPLQCSYMSSSSTR